MRYKAQQKVSRAVGITDNKEDVTTPAGGFLSHTVYGGHATRE